MAGIDMKKEFKHLYNPPSKEVAVVDVPPMNFLMVDGQGDPNTSPEFQASVGTLFGVSYTLKFEIKKANPAADYTVMPLEALWWTEDADGFNAENKCAWKWTLMIAQPQSVTNDLVQAAIDTVKKKEASPALSRLRFECLHEGLCAQSMHIGPYSAERPTIERIHRFIGENGYVPAGKHHEIYLSDPRRCAPEKMKTVVRQPIRAVA